jgi:2-polyprenyl-3-methyl-5-hydroxy-6-metoxy-1,4-benzoquinol methylase
MALRSHIPDIASVNREAIATRLLEGARGSLEILGVYLGDQLGLYEKLAEIGACTSSQLAEATGTHERYIREWVEQQALAGILAVVDASAPADQRRFYLPTGHDDVLTNIESLDYLAPLGQMIVAVAKPIDKVLEAYRTGNGVDYCHYGRDMVEGQGRMNRAAFLQLLPTEWIGAVPDLKNRLEMSPPARVADFGCGIGYSSIGVAMHYKNVQVDGFDFDVPSVERARKNAEEYGVADRVSFEVRDASKNEFSGKYDLVMALECIHDMSDPIGALATMRRLVKPDGYVLVVDERVADNFDPKADGLEWLMYGASILHCLPVGMVETPSAATGTVMRTGTFLEYARLAGFDKVDVLPVDYPMFRFYLMRGKEA